MERIYPGRHFSDKLSKLYNCTYTRPKSSEAQFVLSPIEKGTFDESSKPGGQ